MSNSSLLTLPNEIILHLARFLSTSTLNRLIQTSRLFSTLLEPCLYDRAPHHVSRDGQSVLEWTVDHHDVQITVIKKLQGRVRDHDIPQSSKNRALFMATLHGQTAPARLLVNMGADMDYTPLRDDNLLYLGDHLALKFLTPLHVAANKGHPETVEAFLDLGADINATGSYCGPALEYAIEGGDEKTVALLLDRGAEFTPNAILESAVESGNLSVLRLLLDRGANPVREGGWPGTALHVAAIDDNLPAMKLLLERGVDVNEIDPDNGQTPLHWLVDDGSVAGARFLLDHGADVNFKDGEGQTPLHAAAALVIHATGDVDGSDEMEKPAARRADIVRLLLERGADVFAEDNCRHTPLDVARLYRKNIPDIVRLLEQATEKARDKAKN